MIETRKTMGGVILPPKAPDGLSYCEKNMRWYNQARFLAKVNKTETCWEWIGLRNPAGYGRFYLHEIDPRAARPAHRAAYHLFIGEIPAGMWVLHSCDNKWCVNPDHLRVGDRTDNARDASERGRLRNTQVTACPKGHAYTPDNIYPHGGKRQCRQCRLDYFRAKREGKQPREWANGVVRGKAVLTKELAEYVIRHMGSTPRSVLANRLGVSCGVIDSVRKGRTWKELPRP